MPVKDIPHSPLAIAWRNDVDARPVQQFVDVARNLAAMDYVPMTVSPDSPSPQTTIANVAQ